MRLLLPGFATRIGIVSCLWFLTLDRGFHCWGDSVFDWLATAGVILVLNPREYYMVRVRDMTRTDRGYLLYGHTWYVGVLGVTSECMYLVTGREDG